MASSAAKTVLLVCFALVVTQLIIVYQMRSHNKNPRQPTTIRSRLKSTTAPFRGLEKGMRTELKYPLHETELMTKQMTNKASPTSTLKVIHKRKIH